MKYEIEFYTTQSVTIEADSPNLAMERFNESFQGCFVSMKDEDGLEWEPVGDGFNWRIHSQYLSCPVENRRDHCFGQPVGVGLLLRQLGFEFVT